MKITFVCCPKPFLKEYYAIQNNAIKSWSQLEYVDKIIICGDEEGIEKYATNLQKEINIDDVEKIIYKKTIKRNKYNTPLIDRLFKIGTQTDNEYVCYINSDIVLLNDFDKTFKAFLDKFPNRKSFLLIGQRWDWANPKAIDFSDSNWQNKIKRQAKKNGKVHSPAGIDYFLHTKQTFPHIHPFAIGRFFWDRWIVGNAYKRPEVITVDVTETVFAIHQDSPWYINKAVQTDRKKLMHSIEATKNKSFDRYGRNISDGTRYKSKIKNNEIEFIKKKLGEA
jgi:hypothetical protein